MNDDDNAFSFIFILVDGIGIVFDFNEGGNADASESAPEGVIVFEFDGAYEASKTVFA